MGRSTTHHPELIERYLLGELRDAERADFEAHALECGECAEDLVAADGFVQGLRGLAARPGGLPAPAAETSWWRRFWGPFFQGRAVMVASAAALVLAPVVVYQSAVVVPELRREIALRDRPHEVVPNTLRAPTRGEGRTVTVGATDRQVVLAVQAPAGRNADLLVEVRRDDGTIAIAAFAVTSPETDEPLLVHLASANLPSGGYLLLLLGMNREEPGARPFEMARYPFTLQRR